MEFSLSSLCLNCHQPATRPVNGGRILVGPTTNRDWRYIDLARRQFPLVDSQDSRSIDRLSETEESG